jgi:type II secretion system protein H
MRAPRSNAFTLLELVLVLLIMSIALALVAPSLRGWNRASRLRDAAEQFAAAAGWARSQSASDGVVYRLAMDPASASYVVQVQSDQSFATAPGEFGRPTTLPEGFRFDVRGDDATTIDFYPNGRITPVSVRIASDAGEVIELASQSPAEPLRVVKQ